jgi:hypothetical protein
MTGVAKWAPTIREQRSREAPRHQTDLTDADWAVIEPHPAGIRDRRGGGPLLQASRRASLYTASLKLLLRRMAISA